MDRRKFLKSIMVSGLAVAALQVKEAGHVLAQGKTPPPPKKPKITQADREAAAERMKAARKAVAANPSPDMALAIAPPGPGGVPDYFGFANWAFSPPLRKFVDTLPGLGPGKANNLKQYITVAKADTITYPGSDYYEIEVQEYSEQLHSDLPPTRLRGYVQTNNGTDVNGQNTLEPDKIHYLGPMILARKDRPVRIKFTNKLPTGPAGNLFVPVDTTVMGSGMGPLGMDAMPMNYTQNRADLHLHGGRTPWISDGTPHQWITPAGEDTPYKKGDSVFNVPDMPDPGEGSQTYYYSNEQSARLLFYHDHSFGITRLNVYVGEAAGYLISDPVEDELVSTGVIPAEQIPLIFQDKSFVDPDTIGATDPTWNWGTTAPVPHKGDLWYPHVYSPAQNPGDISGVNPYGRWHYGPWFWPPTDVTHGPVPNPYYDPNIPSSAPWEPEFAPGVPDVSMPGESFQDTAMVNGTAFPSLTVEPKAYRFRILNAANDRFFNLQMYVADSTLVSIDGRADTEIKMVDAVAIPAFPNWPADGREGGVPDPTMMGPSWIQIGTEGGFLPKPVVIPNQPITWNADPTTFNFGNVDLHSLLVAPAERADVIVDFSAFAGQTLIVYNDAPAAFPALDSRLDYYAGAPDKSDTGGHPGPQIGFGPNTRTVMQIKVEGTAAQAFDMAKLEAAFITTADAQGVFAKGQDPIIIPDARYKSAYNKDFPADTYVRIHNTEKTFVNLNGVTLTVPCEPKAIQDEMGEAFDLDYGRMSGKLGLQLPPQPGGNQQFVLQNYTDPVTEIVTASLIADVPSAGDGTQLWKITHNGVDTHPIHFHLFDVQLINRVGWDGAIRPPDDNELGWKDTVRVSPLEDTIVALRPVAPKLPFGVPDSIRLMDVTMPAGSTMGFTNTDPHTGQPMNPAIVNEKRNFGWEYVWHCHILSHEEMDMMRPMKVNMPRALPKSPVLTGTKTGTQVDLTWTDGTPVNDPATPGNPANEIGYRIERATSANGPWTEIGKALANTTAFSDPNAGSGGVYYRVIAYNAAGDSISNLLLMGIVIQPPTSPNNLTTSLLTGPAIRLTWNDRATNETGFEIERAVNGGNFALLTPVGPRTGTGSASYTDTAVAVGNTYAYRVRAINAGGASAYSNTATRTISAATPPTAPVTLTATLLTGPQVRLTWSDRATNETGFVIERSVNSGAFAVLANVGLRSFTGSVNYTDSTVAMGNTYAYRVKAVNGSASSAYTNTATVSVATIAVPVAPSNLTATATRGLYNDTVTLRWTDNANNETNFTVQRATNATFTSGLNTATVAANAITTQQSVARLTTFYYRIRANNSAGSSAWSNVVTITTP